MFITDIKRVIEQVSRDKGIESMVLVRAIEEAIKSAAKKKLGSRIEIEVKYNEDAGEIEVFQFREVVEEITDPDIQIILEEGKKLDPECEAGDSLGIKMDMSTLGRISAQSAKQVIIQKMKDAERDAVYSGFIGRKGEIINGIVQRIDRGNIIVNLGHTEGMLSEREQVPGEIYRRGDRIRSYIMDVRHDARGPQVVLSRTHPHFLINLFKTEVPEISEGIVSIIGAAREPGSRAKFAVVSNDSDIDPVGACVGMKGSRVQNVVQELKGEKIDIIPWHVDPAKFVCNALAPAEISRVIIDEENRSMEVIVPDEFLSIAIGKGGQNVRLASKLTKWRLDVKSETRYSKTMQEGYNSLMALPDIGISMADALYEKGFFSADELCRASVEDIIQAIDITEEEAAGLLENAKKYVINLDTNDETSDNTLIKENDSSDNTAIEEDDSSDNTATEEGDSSGNTAIEEDDPGNTVIEEDDSSEDDSSDVSGDNDEILNSDGSPDDPDVRKPSEKTTDDDYDDS